MIPEPWAFALLALAVFRLWKLLADDEVLDTPRRWLIRRIPEKLEVGLVCPWCLGGWLCVGVWALWWYWPTFTLEVSTPLALSAAVGFLAVVRSALD